MLYHFIIITILLSSQGKHERCHLKGQLPGGFYFFSRPRLWFLWKNWVVKRQRTLSLEFLYIFWIPSVKIFFTIVILIYILHDRLNVFENSIENASECTTKCIVWIALHTLLVSLFYCQLLSLKLQNIVISDKREHQYFFNSLL